MGRVKILKCGDPLIAIASENRSCGEEEVDLSLGSTNCLGPDPEMMQKQIQNKEFKNVGRFYVGSSSLVSQALFLASFDLEENGGLSLALQEDSAKTGKVTAAGMYFLGFPVYCLDQTVNSVAAAKDPDAAFFKKLDGFQPCEITELKPGTHVFAVYGDNFFKSVSYTIEAVCAAPFVEEKENLRAVEADILSKRAELSKFETEYREVLAQFTEMTSRYTKEMHEIDELLKQRNEIHASYTTIPRVKQSSSRNKNSKAVSKEAKEDGEVRDRKHSKRDRNKKKKWYNIHLKVDKRKPC